LRHVPGQEWHLDTATREIGRGDRRIRLAEKPFRVLRALVDAGGEVVTRATLRDLLWSEDTFVDFDNNLNSTVAALRHAFVRLGLTSKPIETIPKVGYRLLMPATDAAGAPAPAISRPWIAAGVATGVAAVLIAWIWVGATDRSQPVMRTVDRDARGLFERGVHLRARALNDRREPPSGLSAARAAFADAFRLDPRFSAAAAEEADTLVEMSFTGAVAFRQGLTEARAAARRALALDAADPVAARVTAMTALILDWNFHEARRWLDRAARAADARSALAEATWLAAAGRPEEAVRAAEQAVSLDPGAYYVRADLAMFYLAAARNAEAVRSSRAVLQAAPDFAPAHAYALIAHERLGQWDDAAGHARALLTASGAAADEVARFDRIEAAAAITLWRQRDLARLEHQAAGRESAFALLRALRHAALGDRAAALQALADALAQRDPLLVFLRLYPELASLHGDPVFRRIAEAIGPSPLQAAGAALEYRRSHPSIAGSVSAAGARRTSGAASSRPGR
jgi:DNA-binding winged helix-turn-helix (wHTH) protein